MYSLLMILTNSATWFVVESLVEDTCFLSFVCVDPCGSHLREVAWNNQLGPAAGRYRHNSLCCHLPGASLPVMLSKSV